MRIDLLCSGSKGNACLVRAGQTAILIDCGPSTKRYMFASMEQCGCALEDLDAVLITHSHSDHIRQLRHFASLPVYACCSLNIKAPKGGPVPLDLHSIEPPEQFSIGALNILALPTSHDSGPSMGFVIDDGTHKLVYITDTGYIPAGLLPDLADADYYVFESNHDLEMLDRTERPMWLKQRIASDTGHLCNEDAARILARCVTARTKNIVLAHLSEEANTPDRALKALYERLEYSHIPIDHLRIEAAGQFSITTIGDSLQHVLPKGQLSLLSKEKSHSV